MTAYLDWKVGDRIVCICEKWDRTHPKLAGCSWPVKGETYTIRSLDYLVASYGEGIVIWLEEISNRVIKFRELPAMEMGFAAKCFRPVQTRTTDISVFTALLNPSDADTFRELEAEILDYELVEVPFR